MKALTIRQPWASLIILGYKRFEFRGWKTTYRGEFLIHAGKTIDKEAKERLKTFLPEELPTGKILGKVTLTNCIKCDDNFKEMCLKENPEIYAKSTFTERYAFEVNNVEKFEEPIEAKGKLNFWEYDLEEK